MADSKIAAEVRAVLEESERSDPGAHGMGPEVLQDLAELLRASAGYVQLQAQADRAKELVVRLARRSLKDFMLTDQTDEEVVRKAGELAIQLLGPTKKGGPSA